MDKPAGLETTEERLSHAYAQLREAIVELETSRDDYAELYELAPLAQLTLAPGGWIQSFNQAAAELCELESETLAARSFASLVHTLDRAQLAELGSRPPPALAEPREVRLIVGSGALIPVQLWARGSSRHPGTLHVALLDLRSREGEAWQKQELVAAARSARLASSSKDQFIAMLSHDLRTPLTPILAAASRWELSSSISAEVREIFALIRRNALIETRLVDDLLDATRILRGKLRVVRQPIDIHALLQQCVASFTAAAEAQAVRLIYAPDAEHCIAAADALRLQQVFTNLLQNALKATPADGAITVRTWNSETCLAIEVLDTGSGFEQHEVARLFDGFDQLDRDLEPGGGLGLGLAICKGLVDLHEGELSATSPGLGCGARFVVELPTTIGPEQAFSPRATTAPPKANGNERRHHILLVEDHQDTAEVLQTLLEEAGFVLLRARSRAEALALDLTGIDAIISDLSLPDGSGHDLLRQLKGTAAPPAIALSGHGKQSDIDASRAAGFDLHLTKPVDFDLLLRSVRGLLTYRQAPASDVTQR